MHNEIILIVTGLLFLGWLLVVWFKIRRWERDTRRMVRESRRLMRRANSSDKRQGPNK